MEHLSYTIKDEAGIHARPAGLIVSGAKNFDCKILIKLSEKTADAKGLFSIMGLAAKKGDTLQMEFCGDDEAAAKEYFENFLPKYL